jgi:hypothetical protein
MLGSTMLLAAFTLSALAVVGAVGWLGRTSSPAIVVAAVALSVALAAQLLVRLLAMMPEHPRTWRHPNAAWLVPGIAAVALLAPLGIRSVTEPPVRPGATPIGTVRGFLGAIVDNDGVTACRYLTTHASAEYAKGECQGYSGDAQLRAGGRLVSNDAQLDQLRYAAHGRVVTVSGHRFVLARATPAERSEFLAPPGPWRVAGGIRQLT